MSEWCSSHAFDIFNMGSLEVGKSPFSVLVDFLATILLVGIVVVFSFIKASFARKPRERLWGKADKKIAKINFGTSIIHEIAGLMLSI